MEMRKVKCSSATDTAFEILSLLTTLNEEEYFQKAEYKRTSNYFIVRSKKRVRTQSP